MNYSQNMKIFEDSYADIASARNTVSQAISQISRTPVFISGSTIDYTDSVCSTIIGIQKDLLESARTYILNYALTLDNAIDLYDVFREYIQWTPENVSEVMLSLLHTLQIEEKRAVPSFFSALCDEEITHLSLKFARAIEGYLSERDISLSQDAAAVLLQCCKPHGEGIWRQAVLSGDKEKYPNLDLIEGIGNLLEVPREYETPF